MEIDWSKAPAWAEYHAVDMDGRGSWHKTKPAIRAGRPSWFWQSLGYSLPSGNDMQDPREWESSLVERPK